MFSKTVNKRQLAKGYNHFIAQLLEMYTQAYLIQKCWEGETLLVISNPMSIRNYLFSFIFIFKFSCKPTNLIPNKFPYLFVYFITYTSKGGSRM